MKRLTYRRPLAEGGRYRYASWLRELRRLSGVYVIREQGSGLVLYVGESHSGQLYDTITRHFQAWSGRTAGTRYNPARVTVAVRTMPPAAAPRHQAKLIARLDPRDNVHFDDGPGFDPADFQD